MNNLLAVALGGALGATLRYGTSLLALRLFGTGFPFGTLIVNGVGSFAMGALYALTMTANVPPSVKAFVGVGMLGALTTFSTFANESVLLFQEGEWGKAIINVLLNVIICLSMVMLGQQMVSANS